MEAWSGDAAASFEERRPALEREKKDKQIALIKELSRLDAPTYLIGGYAVDLLEHEKDGVVERAPEGSHTDIDMLVTWDSRAVLERALAEAGHEWKEKIEHGIGRASKIYMGEKAPVKADFALIDIDPHGSGPFIDLDGGETSYRVRLSPDTLQGPTILFEGTPVRVVSPRALIQSLLAYSQIGRGEVREKDRLRAERLRAKYFPDETLDSPLFKADVEVLPRRDSE